ncbi:fructose-1,6-bisphosphatase [Paraburkholderia sacchari]|uniref:fructose-1,6-bisphosphatase n=1 Tax=Paraburkholderia sacchari TaxID=159450 RepID=UPI001BD06980|nr:fructose-1,6-bisphosphatase [Paraburkholderia sacchari]
MPSLYMTLDDFLARALDGEHDAAGAYRLRGVIGEIALAVRAIAAMIERVMLDGSAGAGAGVQAGARELMMALCERSVCVAGYSAAGSNGSWSTLSTARSGYLLTVEALDGGAQIAENGVAGSIFSVREAACESTDKDACETAWRRGGDALRAAAHALYGPSTLLVLTLGHGTHGFTLDRASGTFVLTHHAMRVPDEGVEVAIDGAREHAWEPPVLRYVRECRAGSAGVRERDFSLRNGGCVVADLHRVLMRGGVSIVPREFRDVQDASGLDLVHAAQPLAWLVEQAGGAASTGRERVLDLQPRALDVRTGVVLGTTREVARIERYYGEYERGVDRPFDSPLFNERSLFRPEACA